MLTKASYSLINGAPINVLDYGADSTGATNSATAIQNALNTGAPEVFFPAGSYLLNSVLTLSPLQKIVGENSTLIIGSVLCGAGTANNTPIITMAERSAISGFIFKTQTQPVINATTTTPVVHPYCIGVNGCSYTTIQNVDFLACWRGVVAGNSAPHECMTIQNMRGTIFETPVYIDQNTDVDRLLDIQLNPTYAVYYGGAGNFTSAAITAYQRNTANANAFTVRKADWLQMNNCFAYGYKRGLLLQAGTETVSGSATISVSNSGFDGSENCIVSTSVINASFDNVTLAATKLASETVTSVVISGGGSFQFNNCFFIGNTYYATNINTSGSVSLVNCQITDHYEGVVVIAGRINLDTVIFKQAGGTVYDIDLSGTASANIRNCRRYDGTASVNNGITATTCPTTYENGSTNTSYLPFFAAVGAASVGIPPTLIASAATYYFATLPAGDANYLVYAGQDVSTNGVYRAIAYVRTGSSTSTVSVLANNGITIVVSGLQVGVTNSSGGDLNVDFGYLKLYQA